MCVNFNKDVPVIDEVDVLVVGAGPAGIGAAISSARNGNKTLIVDSNGCIGGMAAVGMVGPFMTSFDAKAKKMIIRGIFEEIVEDMVEAGHAVHPKEVKGERPHSSFYKLGHDNVGPFDNHYFKLVCTNKILEAGAKILLYTQFVDVVKKDNKIDTVILSNKNGLCSVKAKLVIDCTGDADVAFRSGVKCELGNSKTKNIQPMSLFFRIANVDTDKVTEHIGQHSDEIRPFYGPYSWTIRENKEAWGDIPRAEIGVFKDVEPGVFRINCTRITNADGTKAQDLTNGQITCLNQVYKIHNFMKKYCVGFENSYVIDVADSIGIRETRHIDGEYKLSRKEVADCVVQDSSIAVMATCMDTHNLNDEGGTFLPPTAGDYFGVPYLTLVAKGLSNLLVAGRCISADSEAASAIRMMPSCMAFGQAAGTAASFCIKNNIEPKDVDVKQLRAKLLEQGAYLGN